MTNTRADIYQTVTDTIIEAIENGISGKIEMPWHQINRIPENAKTGNSYQGINIPLLWVYQIKKNYALPVWGTYKQWAELGAQVKRGEKGAPVVFYKQFEVESDNGEEDPQKRIFARRSIVFNAEQVERFDIVAALEAPAPALIENIAAADMLVNETGATIRHEGGQAFYMPSMDYIAMPPREMFRDTADSTATENYYSTLFHELTHWTGAKHRLDRLNNDKFGGKDYAFEELVAELGAAMCCASTGVASSPREDHARYINNWLKALKSDKRFIFAAASQAQKAVDFLFFRQQTLAQAA
ncbi:MAG: peptidase [Micavibrio aeruginosavorus]|uniref:Peptidase n=1 Tax=Micavibrio aeruginosavorus TaxID=349221 RepID=A0A2W5BFH9_9BACT|nr:MAG: peptidase [Micavibrio aeruginosavorus]